MTWVETVVYLWVADEVPTVEDLKSKTSYRKNFFKCKCDHAIEPIPYKAIKVALDMVANQPNSSILLDPFGGAVNRIASDAIAFPHRNTLYGLEYCARWDKADDVNRDEYISWVRKLCKHMKPHVSRGPRSVYVNNLDLDLGTLDWEQPRLSGPLAVELARAWGENYFRRNYDRLVEAKTMIDPFNVFNNPQSIPPLTWVGSAGVESKV